MFDYLFCGMWIVIFLRCMYLISLAIDRENRRMMSNHYGLAAVREGERERQTDKQAERERENDRGREIDRFCCPVHLSVS